MPAAEDSTAPAPSSDARWLASRRGALLDRLGSQDAAVAVSSGCAASGAARHARDVETQAARALERLLAGLAESCEQCGGTVPRERLDAVLTATRCASCAGSGHVDTRWCR